MVDDDVPVVTLLRRYLERSGFQVEIATHPEAALDLLRTASQPFALVVTDLSLPDMTGVEMIAKMRLVQPSLPALISSGYPHVPETPATAFLQKPYLPQQLVTAVKALIGKLEPGE